MNIKILLLIVLFLPIAVLGQTQKVEVRKGIFFQLMEDIFAQVEEAAVEIDPTLERIAVYHIQVDEKYISPTLKEHFEARLMTVFKKIDQPSVVALPRMNTLRIASTDSSFRIINSLPSPHDLWKMGKKLRVDAFLQGLLTYMPGKALILDLSLNKTGTNEVVWARSFTAYVDEPELPSLNPLKKSLIAGLEVFPVQITQSAATDTLISGTSPTTLKQQSVYYGVHQYLWPESRLRYELRFGLAFLTDGIKLQDTAFEGNAFYGSATQGGGFSIPISYNVRTMLYATIVENNKSKFGDWLSVYLGVTRYFALKMPDFTGVSIGLRSDLNDTFSFSAGLTMVTGTEFESETVQSIDEPIRMTVSGLQYELMLLQFTF